MESSSTQPLLPLQQNLLDAKTVAELRSCLEQFASLESPIKTESDNASATPPKIDEVARNLSRQYRSKTTVDLFLHQRPLVEENKHDGSLLHSIGTFLLWVLPKDDDGELDRGKLFCRIPPMISLFLDVLFPGLVVANNQDAIYSVTRAGCRIAHNDDAGRNFVLNETAAAILTIFPRANSGPALQWTSNLVQNVDPVVNKKWAKLFFTPEAVATIQSAFDRAPDDESIRSIGYTITDFCRNDNTEAINLYYTKSYARQLLAKLSDATTPAMIAATATILGNFNNPAVNGIVLTSEESATILLNALRRCTTLESLADLCRAIGNLVCRCPNAHSTIASADMIDELVKCIPRATGNDHCMEHLMRAISNLTSLFDSARVRMRLPETQRLLLDTLKKTTAETPKEWVVSTIGNVMHDLTQKLPVLMSKEAADALIASFPKGDYATPRMMTGFEKTLGTAPKTADKPLVETLHRTINNTVVKDQTYLAMFAAHLPWDSTVKISEILETSTRDEFVNFLKTQKSEYYGASPRPIPRVQGLFAFLDKVEDFVVIRDDTDTADDEENYVNNKNNNNKKNKDAKPTISSSDVVKISKSRLLTEIGDFLFFSAKNVWSSALITEHRYDDSLILSLLPRAKGQTCLELLTRAVDRFTTTWTDCPVLTGAEMAIFIDKLEEETDDNVTSPTGATVLALCCKMITSYVRKQIDYVENNPEKFEGRLAAGLSIFDLIDTDRFARALKVAFSKTKKQRGILNTLIFDMGLNDPVIAAATKGIA